MGDAARPYRAWRDATDLRLERLGTRSVDWSARPEPHKEYAGAPRLALPQIEPEGADLWAALAGRRSRRELTGGPLSQDDLSALLWACQGITARQGPFLLRTAPSAGALYPFETYVSLQAVEGVPPCLTHLHVPSFSLEVLRQGSHGGALAKAALGQGFVARASAVFLWTAVYRRSAWKYGDRALRYLGLDLGHVGQNLCLAAEALNLGCCPVAAFVDDALNEVLGIDGEEEFAYYLAAVGPLRAD